MHIAILGAGRVGSTLGRRFAEAGHTVVYGMRDPDDAKHTMPRDARDTLAGAAARAEVLVLTTSWAGAADALAAAGDLSGKVLIDATNPIGPGMVLTHGTTDSGAEQVARWAPGARVVKAFNSIGMEIMADARFGDARAVLWLCGDDAEACAQVATLAHDIGFEPLRLGPLVRARMLEPAALLWITASGVLGTRDFAWGVLRR
ncbi:MAG: NAD(P)-binding domain-containing protein [Gemmatimonadetes bacterium]|nr:NAD(P)-binding domain-containing protein [Gemmatimonadota bacterium]